MSKITRLGLHLLMLAAVYLLLGVVVFGLAPLNYDVTINVKPASLAPEGSTAITLDVEQGDSQEFQFSFGNTTVNPVDFQIYAETPPAGISIYSLDGVYTGTLGGGEVGVYHWGVSVEEETPAQSIPLIITVDDPT